MNMGTTKLVRIDNALERALKEMQQELNNEITKEYPKIRINLPTTMTSRLAAEKLNGKKKVNFKIRKNGLNEGHIEFL